MEIVFIKKKVVTDLLNINKTELNMFKKTPVCCQRASVTRIAMLAGVLILLVGPPNPDRLKDRGQTK